jgi:hypothetical protein
MPVYSFKRDTDLYIVYAGNKYKLAIYNDVTFSQTFSEEAVKSKTLHTSQYFESAVITKASPANFSFSVPLVPEHQILVSLLVGYDSEYTSLNQFDLYTQTGNDTYKITGGVLEYGRFLTNIKEVLGLSVTGTGKKLERVGDASYTIPGTLQPLPSQDYTLVRSIYVEIDGEEQDFISDIYLELKNGVEWVSNDTVHASLTVTDVTNTIYPEVFTISGRMLNGAITQYVTSEQYLAAQSWSLNAQIYIRIGLGGREYALQLLAPEAVFTNRTDPGDIYTQVYDFRMSSDLDIAQ